MKWVLVDKYDNINSTAELHSGYGKKAAKSYFVEIKKIDESSFDKLWKVMSLLEYDRIFKTTLQNRQKETRKYEWWKEEDSYLDGEKS